MFALLSPRLWLALAITTALAISHGFVYTKGRAAVRAQWDAANVQAAKEAQAKAEALAESATLLRKARDAENARTLALLNADLLRLRNRPDRLPEPARAACQGATGRELSQSDAGFLTRLASEADDLRAALDQCSAWVEAVKR